jgi:hypothetical protein
LIVAKRFGRSKIIGTKWDNSFLPFVEYNTSTIETLSSIISYSNLMRRHNETIIETIIATITLCATLIFSAFALMTVTGVVSAFDVIIHKITPAGGKGVQCQRKIGYDRYSCQGPTRALDINECDQEIAMIYTSK